MAHGIKERAAKLDDMNWKTWKERPNSDLHVCKVNFKT